MSDSDVQHIGPTARDVYTDQMLDWLRAHELDPDDVAKIEWTGHTVWGGDGRAAFLATLYETSADGRKLLNAAGDGALTYTRTVPMRKLLPGGCAEEDPS
jgi:hypothetical protein